MNEYFAILHELITDTYNMEIGIVLTGILYQVMKGKHRCESENSDSMLS